jgi:hypothetical protein
VFLQLKENGIQFSILIQMSGNKFCIHHLYILYQHPQKLESSLKMFGLCLCHRTKNLLALEDFVHFHRQMLKLYPYGDKSSNLQTPFVPSSLQNIFRSSKGSKDIPLNPQFYVLYDIGYIVPSPKTNGGRLDGKGIGVKLNTLALSYLLT